MTKFYILTSGDITGLQRHISPNFSNLSKEDVVVVINTTDSIAEKECVFFCESNGLEYHVTESDGTPATGKNALLEIFEAADHEYMVQIDGDDYLTPHGVWLYKYLGTLKNPPDAVCIKNQVSKMIVKDPKTWERTIQYKFFFTVDFKNYDYDGLRKNLKTCIDDNDYIEKVIDAHHEYYRYGEEYCEDNDAHCRVTFFSKKAAKYRFPDGHPVGEDTIHFFTLKDAHMKGEINFVCNDDAPCTYIYYQEGTGTVMKETCYGKKWDWMFKFNDKCEQLEKEGVLHKKELPLLKINYTEPVPFDDYNTSGLPVWQGEGYEVHLPANATQSSVKNWYHKYGGSIEK